jgi:glc operon protein GlcG
MGLRSSILAIAGLAAAASAPAQAPLSLTAAQAEAIVDNCRLHASARRQSHAVAVVDGGGHLLAALRLDGTACAVAGIEAAGLRSERAR